MTLGTELKFLQRSDTSWLHFINCANYMPQRMGDVMSLNIAHSGPSYSSRDDLLYQNAVPSSSMFCRCHGSTIRSSNKCPGLWVPVIVEQPDKGSSLLSAPSETYPGLLGRKLLDLTKATRCLFETRLGNRILPAFSSALCCILRLPSIAWCSRRPTRNSKP
ncbi:uncharacterized protein EI90DRAFT_1992446 [Cantharellus anzutake]|uniref:uncharacterized protein n=1 Tax=Cantharellus anzutake TaxID=1750568 RepID=UPI001904A576|nr:uncharacterized protein EI90DRAFT_1992446 [Cantharellus anzutake]KAF8326061.1 hypothetical protein EI90DRAFT_1992446 [Cantharellus anzutake]